MRSSIPHCRRGRLTGPFLGLVVAITALTLAMPASAQWKWRDANGRVTASDIPPPRDIPDKDILQRPSTVSRQPVVTQPGAPAAAASAPATAAPASAPVVDKELEARKRAADLQQQAKVKAEEQRNAAIRADNCSRARSHLTTLESGQRLAKINDKGEREVMDDKARADEVRRTREVITSECR